MLWFSKHPRLTISLVLLLAIASFFYYSLVQPVLALYQESKVLPRLIRPARNAILRQDLATLAFEIDYLRPHLDTIKYSSDRLSLFSFLPVVGVYFRDLKNLTAASLPLYDGLIDFAVSSQDIFSAIKFEGWGKPGIDRSIKNSETLSQSLGKLTPKLFKLKDKFWALGQAILKIDENNYPQELKGRKIRENIKKVKQLVRVNPDSFDDFVSLLNLAPEILGTKETQNYLLLIGNEKEIRPGGGLISGYVILSLDQARLKLLKSGDAAFLDENVAKPRRRLPADLANLIKTDGLYLKDTNYSPDFRVSAQTVLDAYERTINPLPLRGVIAVDGQFLSSLTKVVGEIRLEDGTAVNGENVENLLQKFFSSTGLRTLEAQKQKTQTSIFLNELLKKALLTLPQTYGQLLPEIRRLSQEKHLLTYFTNERIQALAEKYNLASRIKDFEGDSLMINHGLFEPSRRSFNLSQKVNEEIKMENKKLIHELKIEIEIKPEAVMNSPASVADLLRVYVPKGSKLISSQGSSQAVKQEEDLDKTIFSSTLNLKPNQKITVALNYETPLEKNPNNEYRLLIQKQAGAPAYHYEMMINSQAFSFDLSRDEELLTGFR